MSVIAQADHAVTNRSNSRSRPICTHIRMDRLYGDVSCDMCGSPSPFGFVYVCTSDVPEVGDYQFLKSITHPVSPFGEELRQAGLSESVVRQAEAGIYTDEQIQLLKKQKEKLRNVIESVSHLDASQLKGPNSGHQLPNPCGYKTCHRCRPYYADRCWVSFNAVFDDEIRPVDADEMRELPVMNASIAKTLGLRPPERRASTGGLSLFEDDSANNSPSSGFTTDGFTTDGGSDEDGSPDDDFWSTQAESPDDTQTGSWTNTQRGANTCCASSHDRIQLPSVGPFVTLREHDRYETPQPTIRPVPTSSVPRRLRRVAGSVSGSSPSHSNRTGTSVKSSISLPTTPKTSYASLPDFDDEVGKVSRPLKPVTHPAFYSPSMSHTGDATSLGSEVEVEGGVALTEEAIRTDSPDLITQM